MGNCFKKSRMLFGDNYLLDPLIDAITEDEEQVIRITNIEKEIEYIKSRLDLLESNTQENLKAISEDLHYINQKTI